MKSLKHFPAATLPALPTLWFDEAYNNQMSSMHVCVLCVCVCTRARTHVHVAYVHAHTKNILLTLEQGTTTNDSMPVQGL